MKHDFKVGDVVKVPSSAFPEKYQGNIRTKYCDIPYLVVEEHEMEIYLKLLHPDDVHVSEWLSSSSIPLLVKDPFLTAALEANNEE